MNVLILHAHPEEKSFSSSLKNIAYEHFVNLGNNVVVKDLYKMNFNPILSADDFKSISNPDYLHILKEQMNSFMNNSYADDLQAEMDALVWADLLVLNFPLWWSSFPAILKGWFDRVMAFGFAYHPRDKRYESGAFKGKKVICCVSAGGSQHAFTKEGEHGDINEILYHIYHGLLYYTGMTVLPPFYTYRTHLADNDTLLAYIEQYKEHLNNLDNFSPIFQ